MECAKISLLKNKFTYILSNPSKLAIYNDKFLRSFNAVPPI